MQRKVCAGVTWCVRCDTLSDCWRKQVKETSEAEAKDKRERGGKQDTNNQQVAYLLFGGIFF